MVHRSDGDAAPSVYAEAIDAAIVKGYTEVAKYSQSSVTISWRTRDTNGRFKSMGSSEGRRCDLCFTKDTFQWRSGATVLNLCNACGIRERRRIKAEKTEKKLSNRTGTTQTRRLELANDAAASLPGTTSVGAPNEIYVGRPNVKVELLVDFAEIRRDVYEGVHQVTAETDRQVQLNISVDSFQGLTSTTAFIFPFTDSSTHDI